MVLNHLSLPNFCGMVFAVQQRQVCRLAGIAREHMSQGSWALLCRYIHQGTRLLVAFVALGLYACGGNDGGDDSDAAVVQPDNAPQEAAVTPEPLAEEVQPEESEEPKRSIRRLEIANREEWSPDLSFVPPQPKEQAPDIHAPLPEFESRLQEVLQKLAFDPDSESAAMEMNELLQDMLEQAERSLARNRLETTNSLLATINNLDPQFPGTEEVGSRLATRIKFNNHLEAAEAAMQRERYIIPANESALSHYRAALLLEPDNLDAKLGLAAVQLAVVSDAHDDIVALEFEVAEEKLRQAEYIYTPGEGESDPIAEARRRIETIKEEEAARLAERAQQLQTAIAAQITVGEFADAELGLVQLIALGEYEADVNRLRGELQQARVYKKYSPGELIQDQFLDASLGGPIMVVIPVGSFFMGSPDTEANRFNNEGPMRRVVFNRGFAMSRHEATILDFKAFVDATGYITDAEKLGNSTVYSNRSGTLIRRNSIDWADNYLGKDGEGDLPVVHVSWNDASEYARWVSKQTGFTYRIPSEAEFEYSLRAGSASIYWWGDGVPAEVVVNTTGERDISDNRRRWNTGFEGYNDGFWGPAPVGSFMPNGFGLFDMGGNISEWTNDCWHGNYVQAPSGPEAWINPGCSRRVIRGGSWSSSPEQTRSAFRLAASPDARGALVGFRLVRDL